ncbi:hypothetical protein TNCV_587681 [Trichonephila clavipes]|nr:hypothetical protein TNCV_587681 [Trichonephila clavipes]
MLSLKVWIAIGYHGQTQLPRTVRQPSIPQNQIDIMSDILSIDNRRNAWELSLDIAVSHQTVRHIMKKCLNMRKIAARWAPHQLTEVQEWNRYAH